MAAELEKSRLQQRLYGGPSLDSPRQTWPISHTLLLTPSFIKGPGSGRGERGERVQRTALGRESKSKPQPGSRTHTCIRTDTHKKVKLKVADKLNKQTCTHSSYYIHNSLWVYVCCKGGGVGAVEVRGHRGPLYPNTAALTATGVVGSRHTITWLRICSL